MALAFDAATDAGSGGWSLGISSKTFTHTTAGANRFLAIGTATYSASLVTTTGITYNGVAMTKANGITATLSGNNQDAELWYLDAPATGANSAVVTYSATADFSNAFAASYTGKTTTGIDANNASQDVVGSTASPACNVNVVHSDCWLVGLAIDRLGSSPTAGTATTVRASNGVGQAIGDSNAVVSTGNQTLAFTASSSTTWPGVCSLSFSEANAGGGGGASQGIMFASTLDGLGSAGIFRGNRPS